MPNLKAKIDDIKKIFEHTPPPKAKLCNCLKKWNLPIRGACLTENVLYYARICCEAETYKPKLHEGICETTFKKRYANHTKSFIEEKNKNNTQLSTEYWTLANKKVHPWISWSIKGNYKSCNPNSKRCSLCLHKKWSPSVAIEINTNYGLLCLIKRPCHHIVIKVASCRCTRNIHCEDFPNF